MADNKWHMPDLNELITMGTKFAQGVVSSAQAVFNDYKTKSEELTAQQAATKPAEQAPAAAEAPKAEAAPAPAPAAEAPKVEESAKPEEKKE
jgi:hypothetical protein